MIKQCNDEFLINKGIDEKYILLYQVWKELTEPKTLDSYQYRITNTLSGIRELLLVIDRRLSAHVNSNHNIRDCMQELHKVIKQDTTLKSHYPVIWRRLVAHLGKTIESESQQRALRYQLQYCHDEIKKDYFTHLIEDTQRAIDLGENEKIIIKAGQIISCCIDRGWSAQALNGLIGKLLNLGTGSTVWDDLKRRLLTATGDTYTVYIPIKVRLKPAWALSPNALRDDFHEQLRSLGIRVESNEEIRRICGSPGDTKGHIENNFYMSVDVTALDYYSASHHAIGICTDAMSLLSFFNSIEAWDASDLNWLAVNNDVNCFQWISYRTLYGTYDYLDGARRLLAEAKNIMSNDSSLKRKLRATLSYSNMGRAASAQEEKFIGTWVALESLCRGDVYDNIISNVLETVPPALCLRYIYQLFRNFIEDCRRCGVDFVFSDGALWDTVTSQEVRVKALIAAFKNQEIYVELLEKCSVNRLLHCRCMELHDLATDNNKLANRIDQHYVNVRFQLSRLYRIRNEIIHDAYGSERKLLLYTEHLIDYLTRVVAEIIMCSKRKNIDDIAIIFEIIKGNYAEFQAIKNEKKETQAMSLLNPLFETGIIDLV